MKLKSNINDVIEQLENIKSIINSTPQFADAMFSVLNAGMGKMKFRIFNKGEDADNVSLGRYVGIKGAVTKKKFSIASDDEDEERQRKKSRSAINSFNKKNDNRFITEYEKFRISRGRQIEYKDLEVDGSLRRSIEVVTVNNNRVVVAITNEETAKIAGYQEEQIGRIRGSATPVRIFYFSQSEFEQVEAEGNAAISQVISQIFNNVA